MNETIPQIPLAVNGQAAGTDALCSMNGFVKIGRHETRDHQCTGRGATPEEAAAHFFGCMDALEAGYAARAARLAAPPPLASRMQRLGLLLACGLEHSIARNDHKLAERLLKAAAIVLAGGVAQTGEGAYVVRSQTEPEATFYEVAGRACTCADSRRKSDEKTYRCKHVLAACLVMKLDDQEKEHTS